MPRRFDYTQGNKSDWDSVYLPEPVYGKNEISTEELNSLFKAFGEESGYSAYFSPQFSTYGKPDPVLRAKTMDESHQWLSENTTGPWWWSESWSNHGHHLDTCIYVERVSDQKAFHSAFGNVFGFRESSDYDLETLAVLKGVLPPLTEKESFLLWRENHSGYRIEEIKKNLLSVQERPESAIRIIFDSPKMQERFVRDWVEIEDNERAFQQETGKENSFIGYAYEGWRLTDPSITLWLDKNARLGGGMSSRGDIYTIKVIDHDIIDVLQRDWPGVWTFDQEKSVIWTNNYPTHPTRAIPDDFRRYLNGEQEFYAVSASWLPVRTAPRPKANTEQLTPALV